jgi:hypothetical protein
MPENVRIFALLWSASWLTAIPQFFLLPNPDAAAQRIGITRSAEEVIALVTYAVMSAIFFPPFWLAVWKRKNWARWFLFIGFLVFLPLAFVHPDTFGSEDSLPLLTIEFAGLVMEVAAFYFIFTGDARPWFSREVSK